MAIKTRRPLAAKAYQLLEVSDLSGGLDLRRSPTLLKPNRARTLRNYSLEEPGALVVRPGYLQFSTTSLGSSVAQGGQRVYASSQSFTLVAWAGNLYRPTDAGVWGSTVASTISSGAQVFFPYDRDLVAVFDGSTNPIRKSTNGSSWVQMGLTASTVAPTASSASSGSLSTSEFEFSFTYKDSDLAHESNGSPLSTISLGSTGAIKLVISNSTDPQVEQIVVYARNKTAGEPVRRQSTTVTQSASTSSTVVIDSSNWTANDEVPTNHDLPPGMKFGVVWKNRWWGVSATVGNRLHFTELFQPQSWPALFYVDMPFERGDTITAVVPQGDTLLVFGQSKIFLIIGQTSLDFEVRPSAGAIAGAVGARAVATLESGVVHAAADGVFLFDGASDRLLSHDIDKGWQDLMKGATAASIEKIAMVYHFPRKELRIAVPRLYPTGVAGEWILDLDRTRTNQEPAWTTSDRTIGGYILWDGNESVTGSRGRLLTWDSTAGLLFEESTGTTANSSDMTAEYQGPTFTLGLHRARFVDLRGEFEPHAGAFTTELLVDGVSQGGLTIGIGAGLAQYGSTTYGGGAYAGAGRRMFYTEEPLTAEGRTALLKTTYTGQEQFRHYTYALGVVPEPKPRSFSE